MLLDCQSEALAKLKQFADSDRHSVLIEGPQGSGKSYLAAEYGNLLGIHDIVSINATVSDLRSMLDTCYNIDTPVVVCIEGLDSGMVSASYVILKFLEEPKPNIYLVVTCSNIFRIPDTIISRSVVATISHITHSELVKYTEEKHPDKLYLFERAVKYCIMSLKDIDEISKFTNEQLDYYEEIAHLGRSDTVSNLAWKLGHYPSNDESNTVYVFRCIMNCTNNLELKKICIDILKDIEYKRVGMHAILAKFAFDYKYGV